MGITIRAIFELLLNHYIWILTPVVVALIGLPVAIGSWIGQRAAPIERKSDQSVSTMVGALLGLLAFTLAFTFNMASSRYDTRRQLLRDEANAIGTLYRRAVLFPDPHGQEVRQLLREYVDIRLESVKVPAKFPANLNRSQEIQTQLWRHASTLATEDARSWIPAWFIESLTQITELQSKRIGAGFGRIPLSVWFILDVITVLSMLAMGYQAGLTGRLRYFPMAMLIFSFAMVITLIEDLDQPQGGLIRIDQAALADVQKFMQEEVNLTSPIIQKMKEKERDEE
ncbi:MAG TPA: DUF4239 domain-containing protein [bacterium]|nr:DUF4239 domain-containing protein [bacterium]